MYLDVYAFKEPGDLSTEVRYITETVGSSDFHGPGVRFYHADKHSKEKGLYMCRVDTFSWVSPSPQFHLPKLEFIGLGFIV